VPRARAVLGRVRRTVTGVVRGRARLRALERLPDRAAALDAAHFGDHEGGRRRLAFDELLLLQIALVRRRARRREAAGNPELPRNSGKRRTASKIALLKAIEEAGGKW